MVNETGDGLRAELVGVGDFEEREAAQAHTGMVGEVIGLGEVLFQGGLEGGHGVFVQAEDERGGVGRGEDFIEENLQRGVRDNVEAEGRFTHFADAFAERGGVFGAKMGVEAEGHLEFVNGLGGEARDEDLVQAFEGVMEALEAGDAFLDGEAGLHGVGEGANPGQWRQIAVG